MKKLFGLSVLLFISVLNVNAQDAGGGMKTADASLKKDQVAIIHPYVSNKGGTQIDTIKIAVRLNTVNNGLDTLKFTLDAGDFPNHPKILNSNFPLKDSTKWDSDMDIIVALAIETSNMRDTMKQEEVGHIFVVGDSKSALKLRLVPENSYNPNKPFWVEVGANLDLASQQVQTNNVFGGVFFYKRELRSLAKKGGPQKDSKILALAAGVYESKNFAQSEDVKYSILPYFNSSSYPTTHPDSFAIFTDTGVVKLTKQIKNIGLFFSPQIRLSNGNSNSDGIHFFASFYAEVLWENIQTNFDYSLSMRRDTIYVPRSTIGGYTQRAESKSFNLFSHYEGFGLPVFVKYDDANLYLNPVFGISNQPSDEYVNKFISNEVTAKDREWKGFFLFQFRLSEEKYGICLSGEVRQLLGAQSNPYITLVLSKKFDLSKLIQFQ